jgi:hypothetical protein
VRRWLDYALATYAKDAAATFEREKDPFANPVGDCLRKGTQGIFDALLNGQDAGTIRKSLHEMVKVRAVQEFSASQAVGFVFQLKRAVREALGKDAADPALASDLADFDEHVDRVGLTAFDIFVACRQQVWELRIREVKRQVSWIVEKINQRDGEPASDRAPSGVAGRRV